MLSIIIFVNKHLLQTFLYYLKFGIFILFAVLYVRQKINVRPFISSIVIKHILGKDIYLANIALLLKIKSQ